MQITAESLAYWYLRLNGCLTITNFIVHPEWKREGVRTDADIVGVRFPHRQEMVRRPLVDDPWFSSHKRPLLVIAEVKKGRCALNGPWTDPNRKNVAKVLSAMGLYPGSQLDKVAAALYKKGTYKGAGRVASLMTFGATESQEVVERYPDVPQVVWPKVKEFIYRRFKDYVREKAWHQTWDTNGEGLYELVKAVGNLEGFCQALEIVSNGQTARATRCRSGSSESGCVFRGMPINIPG